MALRGFTGAYSAMLSTQIKTGPVTLLVLGVLSVFIQAVEGQTTNSSAVAPAELTAIPSTASTNADSSPVQPATVPADGLTADAIAKKTKATYAALQSYSDTGTVTANVGSFTLTTNFKTRLQRSNFYLIEWQNTMMGGKGVAWSDGTGDFLDFANQGPKKQENREMALASATGISSGAAASIPASFFGGAWGNQLSRSHQRASDEKLAGVDCYVLTSSLKAKETNYSTTLWIGKQDSLIHQIKTVTKEEMTLPPMESDENIKKILANQNKPITPEAIADLRKSLTTAREMAANMLKAGGTQSLEAHSDIVTNKTFTPADFKPAAN